VPGPIALATYADPFPPVPPAPGQVQPHLVGKHGPIYPDGASAPYPSYVDLHKGLAPGESASQVLRFFNRDDVVAELDDIRTFVYPPYPYGVLPPYPTSFPTTGGPIDITTGAPLDVPGPLPGDVRAWRTVGWVLQLFQYDFDAANPNGGTLSYRIVPVPSLPPSLAGAAYPDVINIDADGVVRWWSTSPVRRASCLISVLLDGMGVIGAAEKCSLKLLCARRRRRSFRTPVPPHRDAGTRSRARLSARTRARLRARAAPPRG
jgi:hypothetical protein